MNTTEKMDEMIEWANTITTEEEYEEFCEEEAKMCEDIRIMCPDRVDELYDLWCKRINEVVWNIPKKEADDDKYMDSEANTIATNMALKKIGKAMDELDNHFRMMDNKALMPGHYYRGADGVVVKVVSRSKSGKTVYITTHSDDDDAYTQTKRVKVDDCGYEYICYKKSHYVVGVWNETDGDSFRRYIAANIGKPCAVI